MRPSAPRAAIPQALSPTSSWPSGAEHNLAIVMLSVGETNYPLCLLDTMAVSEMVKRPEGALRHFYDWAGDSQPQFVPCFTVYTLIELRRSRALFQQFIEQFQHLPCVLLKGYAQLLEEEVATYPDPTGIDPCAIAFTALGGEGNQLSNLPLILRLPQIARQEEQWNEAGPEIVEGMVSLVPNYPPEGESERYTREEVRQFVSMASFSQLVYHARGFVTRVVDGDEAVEVDAFPTLKAMVYTVFHKFYADRDRKASNSDAFDVLIAAALPYVEAIITENHQAEVLRKTKRCDDFLKGLYVFTLRDFRDRRPRASPAGRLGLGAVARGHRELKLRRSPCCTSEEAEAWPPGTHERSGGDWPFF